MRTSSRTPLPRGPRGRTLVDAKSRALTPVEASLRRFFRVLDRRGVPVLALRGARKAPYYRESTDLDVACLPRHLPRVEEALLRAFERFGVVVVTRQTSRYLVQYQIYAPCGPGRHHHLCVDLTIAQSCRGVPFLFSADIFRGRNTRRIPHRPAAVQSSLLEFLGPYLFDGFVDPEPATRLVVTYEKHPAQLRAILGQIAGTRAADRLCDSMREPGLGAMQQEARGFRRAVLRKAFVDRPLPTLGGIASKFWSERVTPWLRPRGMTVALLGAEGTGKSRLASELLEELTPSFRSRWNRIVTFGLRRDRRRPSRVGSWVRATRIWAQVSFHYALRIQPLRRRNTLVLLDRWIDDWFVNPERYGLRRNSWYVRFLARNTPRPDVVLVMTAPTRILERRRPNLPRREFLRQLAAYEDYANREPRAYLIRGDLSLDDTVDAAVLAVLARSSSPVRQIRREPAIVHLRTSAA